MDIISSDSIFSRCIVIFDEYAIHVSGFVHTQNTPIRGTENPREIQQHYFHTEQ